MSNKQRKKRDPLSFKHRFYRQQVEPGQLCAMEIQVQETDLHILASQEVTKQAHDLVLTCRSQLERYILRYPAFASSLSPMAEDSLAPAMIQGMIRAAQVAGVGPMAAVAGAVAEFVGRGLLALDGINEVMVENGGDIFIQRGESCVSSIYAGESPLSGKVGLRLAAAQMPLGICTSSGTIGHSLSFGSADSVTVLAADTALADTVATRMGNELAEEKDMAPALELVQSMAGVMGMVIIHNEQMGAWGEVELVRL